MLRLNRRRAVSLGLGTALSPLFGTASFGAAPAGKGKKPGSGGDGTSSGGTTPTPTSSGILRVVITIGANNYEVRQDSGRDLGNFVSDLGGFTQRCIRADVAGLPMTVFFRPDLAGDRVEVVFELGRLFNAVPANLGAYAVAIYRDTQLLATVNVPAHYWFSRWRWQSAPRPVVGTVDTLIAQGLLPPYDRASQVLAISPQTYTVMGLAGVQAYMPGTGDRPDIGMLTEPQAQFVRTSDQNALATLRAQAEAAGTVPWHMRDENTGAPIDFRTHPKANWYSAAAGSPYIATASAPVTVDSAHQPALAYLPYLLTGDPYHLEDLQFQATWNWGALPPAYRPSIPQPRAFAWSLRTLAQCARMTPATTPSWLLPQSYWAAQLTEHRLYFEATYVEAYDPIRSVFRSTGNMGDSRDEGPTAPGGTWVDPWQDEFVASIMGWVITMGFTDWKTSFDWKIGGTIARTSGLSNWVRAHAVPYRMILRRSTTSATVQSWAEAWRLMEEVNGAIVIDPNTWYDADMTSLTFARGALVFATRFGSPGAAACLAWADIQIANKGWATAHKWKVKA